MTRMLVTVARAVLVLSAIVCGLWLLFSIYSYKEFLHGWQSVVLLYAIPASLLVFFLVSLKESTVFVVAVSSTLLVAIVAGYTFEAVSAYERFIGKSDRASHAETLGVEFDTSTRHEIIGRLRNDGIDAFPPINPAVLRNASFEMVSEKGKLLPLGGISGKTVVACNESGRWFSYVTDEHGFNNPRGIWSYEHLDIAIVGDSFLEGWCVDPTDDIASHIRDKFPATLNLAKSGNGPLIELASIKEFLEPFHPNVVLWFYYEGNDLDDLVLYELDDEILKQYMTPGFRQQLVEKQAEIDKTLSEFVDNQFSSHVVEDKNRFLPYIHVAKSYLQYVVTLTDLRTRIGLRSTHLNRRQAEYGLSYLSNVLDETEEFISQWNGELVFVYLPMWHRYAEPRYWNFGNSRHREEVLKLVRGRGITLIDIHETFAKYPDPLSFFPLRQFGHYDEAGQEVVATTVLNAIASRN